MNSIKVKDILSTKVFQNSDLIANPISINNDVEAVTIMDLPSIYNWVRTNELLIIGFFMETHVNVKFLKKLKENKIAGIISKKKFKEHLSQDSIRYLLDQNIPIIFIDNQYPWSEVISSIQNKISIIQIEKYKQNHEFHQTLIHYLYKNKSINNLCDSTQYVSDLTIAILDDEGNLKDYSSNFNWLQLGSLKEYIQESTIPIGIDIDGFKVYGNVFNQKHDEKTNYFFVFPFYSNFKNKNYVLLKSNSNARIIDPFSISKLITISSIYSLKQVINHEIESGQLHYRNIILEDLLNLSSVSNSKKREYELMLGERLHEFYDLLLIFIPSSSDKNISMNHYDKLINTKKTIQSIVKTNLIFFKNNYWLVLIPNNSEYSYNSAKNIFNHFKFSNILIGISEAKRIDDLKLAYNEALSALKHLEYSKSSSTNRIQKYNDLGIVKLFSNNFGQINNLLIDEMLKSYIYPLKNYDNTNNGSLLLSLEKYIDNNFSILETSKQLYIHKNTLRARLSKIENILQVNLNDSNSLLNIMLAIQIVRSSLNKKSDLK
ncbi:helix-turn-helix domain-containing protein [Atopobacter phocae]|uniref:helix-turn-helix domain-containing protein n=1 Tax=Atopobacter phocae TaxID=136492 RepID=UPI000472FC4C|nr:helix-turn-helix domain-containing protein [Atopobacter phocae]